jgi:UDP-GlcNAc:undecaprenyl-phosphate GlcNAc-1-phosphate transferase
VATLGTVLGALVVTRLFGHSECRLLAEKLIGMANSIVHLPRSAGDQPKSITSRFQGKREWELLWEAVLELAERFELASVRLNVSSPAIGEEFHASWSRKEQPEPHRFWKTEIPLFRGHLSIGRLIVSGAVTEDSAFGHLSEFLEALKPFEEQLHDLLQVDEPVSPKKPDSEVVPVAAIRR